MGNLKKSFEVLKTYKLLNPNVLMDKLVYTGQVVKIDKTAYKVAIVEDVPGKHLDLIVYENFINDNSYFDNDRWAIVIQVMKKYGRYDGTERRRYAIRPYYKNNAADYPSVSINIVEYNEGILKIGLYEEQVPLNIDYFQRVAKVLNEDEIEDVIIWNWTHYFSHLSDYKEINNISIEWKKHILNMIKTGTLKKPILNLLNRMAQERLSIYSKSKGWIKLTLGQKKILELENSSNQWFKTKDIENLYYDKILSYPFDNDLLFLKTEINTNGSNLLVN